jgi:hypothetical protein
MGKSSRGTLATALARLKKLLRKWEKVKAARTMKVGGVEKYLERYLATAPTLERRLSRDERNAGPHAVQGRTG